MIIGTVNVGDKFSAKYVNNLYAMLKRNIEQDFTFVCITDIDTPLHPGIERVEPFVEDAWGWWHFMQFYVDDWGDEPRMYFGLDTIIHGDISRAAKRTNYTLSLDFNYLIGNPNSVFAGTWADCAAVIPAHGMEWLWDAYLHEHKQGGLGSSFYPMHVWVTHKLIERTIQPAIWQQIDPSIMCSYKWPSPKIEQPPEPMVFFHGQPMIHEVLGQSPWIQAHWHAEDL